MNIELYINKQLCDIENPANFSIFLKRQFLNPAELNTKDAMKSYSITLPATTRNNEIFGFTNVEEIRGKFATIYDAYLNIGGLKIFDGKFRLSEINRNSYSGNLLVLAQRSIKEVFGDKNMNEGGEWLISFADFAPSVKKYNNTANAECIFPYVMYSLLPKTIGEDGRYSDKEVWDNTVTLGIDDFPPSINCLQAVRQIFVNQGLNISGSAFSDHRLANLYMSYKNPSDYQMLWNYGRSAVNLKGEWDNFSYYNQVERLVTQNQRENDNKRNMYVVDLFNVTNLSKLVISGNNANIVTTALLQVDNTPYRSVTYIVPFSGLYKVRFEASITLDTTRTSFEKRENVRVISPKSKVGLNETIENFSKRRFEVKLMRDWGEGNFELDKVGYDRSFYKDNLNQDDNFDKDNPANYPKFFPKPDEVMFVDPLQNTNLVCGLSFGANYGKNNPVDTNSLYCNPIAIKHGRSWSNEPDSSKQAQSAVFNSGYMKWGETQEGEIDYSDSDQFKVELLNTNTYTTTEENYTKGNGLVEQVIWLNKGERLTVCGMSDEGEMFRSEFDHTIKYRGWLMHSISFDLTVEPFKTTNDFLKMDNDSNSSIEEMDYNDPDTTDNFLSDDIDLIRFLPSNIKIDNWLENFCKAFNLNLTQVDNDSFELNVKQTRKAYSRSVIDLDSKANVDLNRKNSPLNLPSAYEIGFTINKDEQGFVETGEDGGGRYDTGNTEGNVINQSSSFSFNWFKLITFVEENKSHNLPIITDKEIWEDKTPRDYAEMMGKDYTDFTQRFWYKGENIEISGFGREIIVTTLVKNEIEASRLNYHNKPSSILSNYFTIFVNNDANYTVVDCYLTPDEYNNLPYNLIRFNGDIYYPAEIDGYDPLGRRKATLKLIRKIL